MIQICFVNRIIIVFLSSPAAPFCSFGTALFYSPYTLCATLCCYEITISENATQLIDQVEILG